MTMDAHQFRAILKGEIQPEEISLDVLNEEIRKAPYAAALYVLKAMASHSQQQADFEVHLQQAAARTLSRSRLKEIIEGPVRLEIDWLPAPDAVVEELVSELEFQPELQIETEAEIPEFIPNVEIDEVVAITESSTEEKLDSEADPQGLDIVVSNIPEPVAATLPKALKNDFGFGFVKVPVKKSREKDGPVIPIEPTYQLPAGPVKKKKEKKPEDAIIERFLEKPPGFIPPKLDFGDPTPADDLAQKSGLLAEEIVTENMAMIYLKQKNYEKALSTFRKLQLKFPEKSDYFAALIKNLESQTKN